VVVASLVSAGGVTGARVGGADAAEMDASRAAASGSHRVRRVLRVPTVDPEKIRITAQVGLEGVPAPVERLTLRLEEFELRSADQQDMLRGGNALVGGNAGSVASGVADERVQAGLRQVRAALGDEAILQVLEVEPESRVLERHAVLVPRHVHDPSGDGVNGALRGVSE
jgi:protein ImuB